MADDQSRDRERHYGAKIAKVSLRHQTVFRTRRRDWELTRVVNARKTNVGVAIKIDRAVSPDLIPKGDSVHCVVCGRSGAIAGILLTAHVYGVDQGSRG